MGWSEGVVGGLKYEDGGEDVFEELREWEGEMMERIGKRGGGFITML